MTRSEIKKLVDSGKITFQEFTDNSDMVFVAIKDRYGEVVDLGNNIMCVKDTNGDVVKNDSESLKTLVDLMTRVHSDSSALIEILRYLVGLGTKIHWK